MGPDLGRDTAVFVVGAGIMGAGIAQVAAQAGHAVKLFDAREGAAAAAVAKLASTLDGLAAKGKLDAAEAKAVAARIVAVPWLDDAAGCGLVVEAIVENAEAKKSVFRDLETVVGDACVLASNTSSISVTALAAGLRLPGRFVGMHFFNPVPLMKLVEVVSGLSTDPAVAEKIVGPEPAVGQDAGACAVDAGLHRQPHRPAVLRGDAGTAPGARCRAGGHRRLPARSGLPHGAVRAHGPDRPRHQLRGDAIGLRCQLRRQALRAFACCRSEMVDGGLLGRKSSRGFYRYPGACDRSHAAGRRRRRSRPGTIVALHGSGRAVARWSAAR